MEIQSSHIYTSVYLASRVSYTKIPSKQGDINDSVNDGEKKDSIKKYNFK